VASVSFRAGVARLLTIRTQRRNGVADDRGRAFEEFHLLVQQVRNLPQGRRRHPECLCLGAHRGRGLVDKIDNATDWRERMVNELVLKRDLLLDDLFEQLGLALQWTKYLADDLRRG